jgi:hypothetical protein
MHVYELNLFQINVTSKNNIYNSLKEDRNILQTKKGSITGLVTSFVGTAF